MHDLVLMEIHKIWREILSILNCAKSENSKLVEMSFFPYLSTGLSELNRT